MLLVDVGVKMIWSEITATIAKGSWGVNRLK